MSALPDTALPLWPAGLPTHPRRQSYRETFDARLASFETDEGDPIERPASSVRRQTLTLTFIMDHDQVALFDDFVWRDLKAGTKAFQAIHPRTRLPVEMRLVKEGGQLRDLRYHTPFKNLVTITVKTREAV